MKSIFSIILVVYSLAAYPQNKTIDSLKKVLQTQQEDTSRINTLNILCGRLWRIGDYDNLLKYAQDALALADKLNFKKGKRDAYNNLGEFYFYTNNFPEALKAFQTTVELSRELKDKRGIAYAYKQIAVTYSYEGNNSESIKYHFLALAIFKETGDKFGVANEHQYIGVFFENQNNYDEGLVHLFEAVKGWKEVGEMGGLGQTLNTIGIVYTSLGRYADALKHHFAALKIFLDMGDKGPVWGAPFSYNSIGKVYLREGKAADSSGDNETAQKKFSEALKYELLALQLWKKINMQDGLADQYFTVGDVYTLLKDYKTARKYFEKSLLFSHEAKAKYLIASNYLGLSKLDSIRGDYTSAFKNYKNYILYRDSLNNEDDIKKVEQVKMQYDFDKKQDSIKAVQDKKDALAAAEIKTQKLARNFSLGGAFAVLSFGGYSFYRYRRRRKLQSQQEMLNERLRISRELHDDIGSTLGGISIYSEVAKNRSERNEKADEAIAKIGSASRELIEKMSDIVWSINPNNESFEQLQNRMQTFAAMMLTPRNIQNNFIVDEELKNVQLTTGQRKNIFLIFKEAIHNIVKYSECKKVEISLSRQNDMLTLNIKDDGKGFDSLSFGEGLGEVYNGNGLKNMQGRARDINASLDIRSEINEGTAIQLILTT